MTARPITPRRASTRTADPTPPDVHIPRTSSDGGPHAGPVPEPEQPRLVLLDRLAIEAAEDVSYEVVNVPKWGGSVRLRSLTGAMRDRIDREAWRAAAAQNVQEAPGRPTRPRTGSGFSIRSLRVALALCDAAGEPLYPDPSPADVDRLGSKAGDVIDMLDDVVIRLSALGTGAVGSAAADLKAEPSDGSGSD